MTELRLTNDPTAATATAEASPTVAIDSAVLGHVDVPAEWVYTFPVGLVGLESARRFALIPAGRDGVFWLQSAEDPALVFVLADPFPLVAGYAPDVPDADLAALGAADASEKTAGELLVLTILTLGGRGGETTANLRAPVVFSLASRRARQTVLPDDRYAVATPVTF